MNPMPEIIPMLKQLRLSGILDSLESRNRQAASGKDQSRLHQPRLGDPIGIKPKEGLNDRRGNPQRGHEAGCGGVRESIFGDEEGQKSRKGPLIDIGK